MSLFDHLCLITAVDVEFRAAASLLDRPEFENVDRFRICRDSTGRVTLFQTGMGAAGFPDFLAERIVSERFPAILVAGLAGALVPSLKRCNSIVYDRCFAAAPLTNSSNKSSPGRDENESIPCDPLFSQAVVESLLTKGISCERGNGLTVNRIITSSSEKLRLGEHFHAHAVDMETYHLLRVARDHGLPAAAVRIISDEAGQDLPDFNRAYDAHGQISPGPMVQSMISRPSASARFLIGIRPVLQALRQSLAAILATSVG
ncbi:MAG: hypothetical protein IPM66_17275 [Acidobacteriota bacterium]|nr:MAG: hypothetical protein IPM66_17275 [Acidobacteriota bacterium]